ncbi:MAG: DUF5615 family PIN-like protein [Anaerolineae bacterium]|nr:DUF5615 family PIN-like protein [Anaerolineae bacterium]MCB0254006.1 DUF5615 family PIN-like protein [Anaerolineae bacterium]
MTTRIRFQADADLNEIIVKATLRLEPSIDFQTAHTAGLAGMDDPDVLRLAAEQGRLLVSHDRRTIPAHFGQFILSGRSSGLLIVSQKLQVSQVAEDLLLIWSASKPEEWVNQLRSLPL